MWYVFENSIHLFRKFLVFNSPVSAHTKGKTIRSHAQTGPEASRFRDNLYKKTYASAAFTYQEIFLLLISFRNWVKPRTIFLPERIKKKISMIPSGIETATFRLAAQCLKEQRHSLPQSATIPGVYFNQTPSRFILRLSLIHFSILSMPPARVTVVGSLQARSLIILFHPPRLFSPRFSAEHTLFIFRNCSSLYTLWSTKLNFPCCVSATQQPW